MINKVLDELRGYRFTLTKEKILQNELNQVLAPLGFIKEYSLDSKSIIDFYNPQEKIGIEVKVKGAEGAILRQCSRYCRSEKIDVLILVSNKALIFPKELANKPCYFFNLGEAWL